MLFHCRESFSSSSSINEMKRTQFAYKELPGYKELIFIQQSLFFILYVYKERLLLGTYVHGPGEFLIISGLYCNECIIFHLLLTFKKQCAAFLFVIILHSNYVRMLCPHNEDSFGRL